MMKKKKAGYILLIILLIVISVWINETGTKTCPVSGRGIAEMIAGQGMLRLVEKSVDPPRAALTFDDGPGGSYTSRLLDGLKERNVKASFFLLGEKIEQYPELVERMQKEGHLIGNHTYHHVQLDKIGEIKAREEILKTNNLIYETQEFIHSICVLHLEHGKRIWNCAWKCCRYSGRLTRLTGK